MHIKTFMIPKNHEYVSRLKSSLEKIDIDVVILKPFHYSSVTNIFKLILFRLNGFRLVHVHWLYIFPFGFVMKWFYFFCKTLGIKVIWEMHNILPHNYSEADKENSKWFYEKADAIIFHSSSDIDRAKECYKTNGNKTHIVIPHGNFNESYENTISKSEARKRLNIADGKRVILCFGFIRKNRGYEYLIDATNNMENTEVIVAGKILENDVYERLLEYKTNRNYLRIFAKFIPNEEVQIYFNACDVVVLPYTYITTSGVIPLAYAFSKPVITTAIGGIKDVVINNKTGIIVPPKDTFALRKAIERIFTMDVDAMGKYAYEYAKREFSWDRNTEKIKELYESLSFKKLNKSGEI